jgi:hypothetical protein
MSMLKNLTTDETISNETDRLGGGGVLESNLYPATIKLAYLTVAGSGALGLAVNAKTSEGREIRETMWVTSGTEKGGKNYYEKDGQKHYLQGFLIGNSLALLATGKELADLDTEEKVIKLYSKDAGGEVPTKVQVVTDLLDKEILLGVIKELSDKSVKGDDGKYHPTGETRDQNVIDKVFRASDKKTTAEIRAQAEEATFYQAWADKWAGKVRDKSTSKSGASGSAGAPGKKSFGVAANAPSKKPASSLFA